MKKGFEAKHLFLLLTSEACILIALLLQPLQVHGDSHGPLAPQVADIQSIQVQSQYFVRPTVGEVTSRFSAGDHNGVDISDTASRPTLPDQSALCLAENGSLDVDGNPLLVGDWKAFDQNGNWELGPDNICDDWQGPPVFPVSDGLITEVGISPRGGHRVVVFHGNDLSSGSPTPVETIYVHMGTKIRDASRGPDEAKAGGPPIQSFVPSTTHVGSCVNPSFRIGAQGYSGNTTGTHLHFELRVGGVAVDPASYVGQVVELEPPTECARVKHGSFEEALPPTQDTFCAEGAWIGWTKGVVDSHGVNHCKNTWQVPDGVSSVALRGNASISQVISTIPGESCTLNFAIAGNIGTFVRERKLAVLWDGAQISEVLFDTTGHTPQDMGWEEFSFSILPTQFASTLGFQNVVVNDCNSCDALLDDVSVECSSMAR